MTADRLPTAANYPVPKPESGNDPRFSLRLVMDVADRLRDAGFPPVTAGRDLVRLMEALFAFCYSEDRR